MTGAWSTLPAEGDEGRGLTTVAVDPAEVVLSGADARIQLLVTGTDEPGRPFDLTPTAGYQSSAPGIATVNARGELTAAGDGAADRSRQ